MCGINGIFYFDKIDKEQSVKIIKEMNNSVAHRGPDNDSYFINDNVVLGHRRLKIIDLSDNANQPMFSYDKRYVIVYNGEIYNFLELKKQLQNHYFFKSNSDTEVILAAYLKWGKDALNYFNGMFAFAIYDTFNKELFLARDRVGIKPLYYFEGENYFIFSSEIRSILKSGLVKKELNFNALIDFLRFQTVISPQCIIKNIKLFPAGSFAFLKEDEFQIKKYWDISNKYIYEISEATEKEIYGNVKALLVKSIERRLISDVPFGAFLSGGIDSSLIVAIISKILNKQIDTFSVVFDDKELSEAKYSRLIAKKFNTKHNEIKLNINSFLELLPEALSNMDHPSGDGPNTYVVAKKAKEAGITMALSGLGGDELFAGYPHFTKIYSLYNKRWILSFPKILRKLFANINLLFNKNIKSLKLKELLTLDYFDLEYTYPLFRQIFLDKQIIKMVKEKLPANSVHQIAKKLISYGSAGFNMPYLSKISILELNSYLQNVLLRDADQMTMANALELRVPFLDHQLIEYVINVPDKFKYPNSPKQLLINSFANILPDEIVHRPKMGFILPWDKWLKSSLYNFANEKINSFAQRDFINSKYIKKYWKNFLKGSKLTNWTRIWIIIVLEDYLQRNNVE